MNRMTTRLTKIEMKNPVTVASGTFGLEYGQIIDLNRLGALITKTITRYPKEGNPPPRLYETPGGLLNSIGLQNPGLEAFISDSLPEYREIIAEDRDQPTRLIVSFSGSSIDEFLEMLEKLENEEDISGYEINISCPNVEKEGLIFGVDPSAVFNLTKALKGYQKTDRELIIKLSPNVTDIVEIARAAEEAGCDSLSMINTLLGMAIDWQTGKTYLKRGFGGLSGPAIKPVALYNVYRVARNTKVPILAMGGITTWQDALEFFYAGANAVAIGTANFINPGATIEIIDRLEEYFSLIDSNLQRIVGKVDN